MIIDQLKSTRNIIASGLAEYQQCSSELVRQQLYPDETPYDRLSRQEKTINDRLLEFYKRIVFISESKKVEALLLPENHFYVASDMNGKRLPYIKVKIPLPLPIELALCKFIEIGTFSFNDPSGPLNLSSFHKIDFAVLVHKSLGTISRYFFIVDNLSISIQVNDDSFIYIGFHTQHNLSVYEMSFVEFLRFIFTRNELRDSHRIKLSSEEESMMIPSNFLKLINYDDIPVQEISLSDMLVNINKLSDRIIEVNHILGLLGSTTTGSDMSGFESYPEWYTRF